ncbi:hypothetical protein CAPTEDRAFT_218012 [Capitella teleta]|uniref:Receptor ligand binding region domain-containing protein n=1 Tax=Capitella teleta TaxID=283909 RepID=R7U6N5_CAPTE|nr:hypothetical protein CAPTEDRAFT_218012 [Capitella teleta]|eukprot:ELT99306.1 hypothetical protein CAPTEDRAFT_218012 [Capitella teleta]
MGMAGSDYVYFYYSLIPYEFTDKPWGTTNLMELWDGEADTSEQHVDTKNLTTAEKTLRRAFKALRPINMADLYQSDFRTFNKDIEEMLKGPPWNNPNAKLGTRYVSSFLFDATYAYLLAVNASVTEGTDWKDGRHIVDRCKGMSFMGKAD